MFERETTRSAQVSITHSQGIQVGDHNVQDLRTFVITLAAAIDESNGSDEEKAEAKSRLQKLLEHPLVAAIVGAGVGAMLGQSGE